MAVVSLNCIWSFICALASKDSRQNLVLTKMRSAISHIVSLRLVSISISYLSLKKRMPTCENALYRCTSPSLICYSKWMNFPCLKSNLHGHKSNLLQVSGLNLSLYLAVLSQNRCKPKCHVQKRTLPLCVYLVLSEI